jgi:alpha-aminoadipate carrier protein LysW
MFPSCPECAEEIVIDELDVGLSEIISCPECGAEVQVIGLTPIELAPVPLEEADEWGEP